MRLRTKTAPTSGDQIAPPVPEQRRSPPTPGGQVPPAVSGSRRSHIGGIVAGSLFAGFATAVILPLLPVDTVDADFATAMVLFGWAFGWALMAVLSMRFTDQPQRWAVAPAKHTRGSALLGWVRDDAEYLAKQIQTLADSSKRRPRAATREHADAGESQEESDHAAHQ